ncbi:MAG: hypothetical protein WA431_07165 [Candidatus Cybelea sp.]
MGAARRSRGSSPAAHRMRGDNYPDRPAKIVVAGHTKELRKRGVRFARNPKTCVVERDDGAHRQGTFVALRETFQVGAKLRETVKAGGVTIRDDEVYAATATPQPGAIHGK